MSKHILHANRFSGAPCHGLRRSAVENAWGTLLHEDDDHTQAILRASARWHDGACDVEQGARGTDALWTGIACLPLLVFGFASLDSHA